MSLIFEETKTLTPNDTKTNVPLQFYVAEELEKMTAPTAISAALTGRTASKRTLFREQKAHADL